MLLVRGSREGNPGAHVLVMRIQSMVDCLVTVPMEVVAGFLLSPDDAWMGVDFQGTVIGVDFPVMEQVVGSGSP